jgi:hypothetical protein
VSLKVLAAHAAEAGAPGSHATLPAVSICSGRSYSYVEAMSQALGLTVPVLFEGGGGLFDPVAAQKELSPDYTPEIAAALDDLRAWYEAEAVPGTQTSVDYAKRTQAGVVTPDEAEITALAPRVEAYVRAKGYDLDVHTTPASVDVVPPGLAKQDGMAWLADRLGLELGEVAYIGDTSADLEALRAVGTSFAPANAAAAVREAVDHVTEAPVLDGTLAAYRWCVAHNERASSEPAASTA